jgi:hypothetical protein
MPSEMPRLFLARHGDATWIEWGWDQILIQRLGEAVCFSPCPLMGEGWGGGEDACQRFPSPPTLTLPHKDGGNKKRTLSASLCIRASKRKGRT